MSIRSAWLYSWFLGLTIFLFSQTATAQRDTTSNSFLWRIERPDKKKPSYLVGTVHISNNSVFNFKDSLYSALQNTDGFAMEISPDSAALHLLEQVINAKAVQMMMALFESSASKQDLLTPLSQQFGIAKAELTPAVIRQEMSVARDERREKNMDVAMDLWLNQAAGRMGKWRGAVEDMEDQLDVVGGYINPEAAQRLLTDRSIVEDTSATGFISIYRNDHLGLLDSMITASPEGYRMLALNKRNEKMARRMDSLMAFRTMTIAVGSAHLPGDSGVISLLRKRGYTVTPVHSSTRIPARNFALPPYQAQWQKQTDSAGHFTAEFPGPAAKLKVLGQADLYLTTDIGQNQFYAAMSLPLSIGGGEDSVISRFVQLLGGAENRFEFIRESGRDGFRGALYEKIGVLPGYLQVFVRQNRIYAAMAIPGSDNDSGQAFHFLGNFRPLVTKDVLSDTFDLQQLSPRLAGVLPFPLQRFTIPGNFAGTFGMNGEVAFTIDAAQGTNAVFFRTDLMSDDLIDDSAEVVRFFKEIAGEEDTTSLRATPTGRGFAATLKKKMSDGSVIQGKTAIQRNEVLMLLVKHAPDPLLTTRVTNALANVKLRFQESGTGWQIQRNDSFCAFGPAPFLTPRPLQDLWAGMPRTYYDTTTVTNTDSTEVVMSDTATADEMVTPDTMLTDVPTDTVAMSPANVDTTTIDLTDMEDYSEWASRSNPPSYVNYISKDSATGYRFTVTADQTDSLWWYTDKAHFEAQMAERYADDDSLGGFHWAPDSLSVRFALYNYNYSGRMRLMRKILTPGTLYTLETTVAAADSADPLIQRFFDDFSLAGSALTFVPFGSKAAQVLQRYADSLSTAEMMDFGQKLHDLPFVVNDTALLQKVLLDSVKAAYKDWNYITAPLDIYQQLAPESFYGFAQNRLLPKNNLDPSLKERILELMLTNDFSESSPYLTLVVDRYRHMKPAGYNYGRALGDISLDDSMLAPSAPALVQLLEQPDLVSYLLRPVVFLLETKSIDSKLVKPYEKRILAYADSMTREAEHTGNSEGYTTIAKMLGLLGTRAAVNSLSRMAGSPSLSVSQASLEGYIALRKAPPNAVMNRLGSNIATRIRAYETLSGRERSAWMPAAYRTPPALSESRMWQDAYDHWEDSSLKVEPLETLVRQQGKEVFRVLTFRITTSEGSFLGMTLYKEHYEKKEERLMPIASEIDTEHPLTNRNQQRLTRYLLERMAEQHMMEGQSGRYGGGRYKRAAAGVSEDD